jgi:hypothetical protein
MRAAGAASSRVPGLVARVRAAMANMKPTPE